MDPYQRGRLATERGSDPHCSALECDYTRLVITFETIWKCMF